MVKLILPLAFLTAALATSPVLANPGLCDHVDLEVIKELDHSVTIDAEGYEASSLRFVPLTYQGCNVEPKTKEGTQKSAHFTVDASFYFFKGQFNVPTATADAMQTAFDNGQSVQLIFRNHSVIELDGRSAR